MLIVNIPINHTFYSMYVYITTESYIGRMMGSFAEFALVIFTATQAKSFQYDCNNSDVYLPPPPASSGMDDLQQLQYCLIDNCTIMRLVTGQQLDIVYTTQSNLVVTPTDGQTSLLIPKNEPEQFCFPPYSSPAISTAVLSVAISLSFSAILSGYTVAVFLFFKELRTTFGKLMMIFSIGCTFHSAGIVILIITTYVIKVNSLMICYVLWFSMLQASMITEGCTTCIIAFLAYIMHSSYKSMEVREDTKKRLLKNFVIYILVLPLLFQIFMISVDIGTGEYQNVILPNGYCSYIP